MWKWWTVAFACSGSLLSLAATCACPAPNPVDAPHLGDWRHGVQAIRGRVGKQGEGQCNPQEGVHTGWVHARVEGSCAVGQHAHLQHGCREVATPSFRRVLWAARTEPSMRAPAKPLTRLPPVLPTAPRSLPAVERLKLTYTCIYVSAMYVHKPAAESQHKWNVCLWRTPAHAPPVLFYIHHVPHSMQAPQHMHSAPHSQV